MSDKKKYITERLHSFNGYEFEVSLDYLINLLITKRDELKNKGYDNIYINHNYYEDSSDEFELKGDRLETDAEFTKRIAENKKAKERADKKRVQTKLAKEKKDKEEYERLKKKFESTIPILYEEKGTIKGI